MTSNPPSLQRRIYAQRLSEQHSRSICSGFANYERRKSEWKASHPDASPGEFDAAMMRIARECGV